MKRIAKLLLLLAVLLSASLADSLALTAPQDNWYNYSNLNWTSNGGMYLKSIAVGTNGKVYVGAGTSFYNGGTAVQIYTHEGAYVSQFGSFADIRGVACDASSNVYVFDVGAKKVRVFDENGSPLREWGTAGTGEGQFGSLIGQPINRAFQLIAVDSGTSVYVADQGNHRVQKFDSHGNYLLKWGGSGKVQGEFDAGPYAVSAGPKNQIYISSGEADTGTQRVQVFDPVGGYLDGTVYSTGQFQYPLYSLIATQDGLLLRQHWYPFSENLPVILVDESLTQTVSLNLFSIGFDFENLSPAAGFATGGIL